MSGYLALALFPLGQLFVVLVRTRDAEGSHIEQVLKTLEYFLWIGLPVVLFLGVWRAVSVQREMRLAKRFPESVVLSAGRTPPLATAVTALRGSRFRTSLSHQLTLGFTVVIDREFVSFWTGSTLLYEVYQFDRRSIVTLEPTVVMEKGRSSRGIRFVVAMSDGEVSLPVVITGAGLGGLFPLKLKRLEQICEWFVEEPAPPEKPR